MIQQNEVVTLIITISVWIFIFITRKKLKTFPSLKLLLTSFFILSLGWSLTILEGFFWKELLNLIEHICYTISALIITFWCWKISKRKGVQL